MKSIARIHDVLYLTIDYLLVLLLCAGLGTAVFFSYRHMLTVSAAHTVQNDTVPAAEHTPANLNVTIPAGTNAEQLAMLLVRYGVIAADQEQNFVKFWNENHAQDVIPASTVTMQTNTAFEQIANALAKSAAATQASEEASRAALESMLSQSNRVTQSDESAPTTSIEGTAVEESAPITRTAE